MSMRHKICVQALVMVTAVGLCSLAQAAEPPKPYGALPSERQLQLHEMEMYGFMHFTVNTFTDKEWGYGDEKESIFNPTEFDADQMARTFKAAGLGGIILTCKHHDGFCLWPSKFTEHSVKNSSWKAGQGDVVRELSEACKRHGLKFGVYLSPWDRNHKDYGKPEYITYYRNQLRELLTQYGPIFEVWLDGANGGDGYYGGARTRRNIDNSVYYDWDNTWKIIRELQPGAGIFSDSGADTRWVGNESGHAGDPCWATYTPHGLNGRAPCPGGTRSKEGEHGHRDGQFWMPAETDFSIRPGWFYHASQDRQVRTAADLLNHYFITVGRGALMNLNVPPDRRGRIHENDVKSLTAFGRLLKSTFGTDLARFAKPVASHVRGGDEKAFGAANLLDANRETYWATDDAVTTPDVTLEFAHPVTFNVVRLREAIRLGQRVDDWALDAWQDNAWREFAKGSAIGACRLVRGQPMTASKVRLRVTKATVCPAISEFGLFLEPISPEIPTVRRDRQGSVAAPDSKFVPLHAVSLNHAAVPAVEILVQ
jgi:alpha-L-fucosidase